MNSKGDEKVFDLPELREKIGIFSGRDEAGQVLAKMLAEWKNQKAIVLAIPAGGVPVAKEISSILGLPLDLAIVKKITPPFNTEFGYGAIAFDGTRLLNENYLEGMGLSQKVIDEGTRIARKKVSQRMEKFRGHHPFPNLKDQTVFLVDDGLATGITLLTAIRAIRNLGAKKIIVAVPTAHQESIQRILSEVDAVICPNIRSGFRFAVADAYENWYDISDEELMGLLGNTFE